MRWEGAPREKSRFPALLLTGVVSCSEFPVEIWEAEFQLWSAHTRGWESVVYCKIVWTVPTTFMTFLLHSVFLVFATKRLLPNPNEGVQKASGLGTRWFCITIIVQPHWNSSWEFIMTESQLPNVQEGKWHKDAWKAWHADSQGWAGSVGMSRTWLYPCP